MFRKFKIRFADRTLLTFAGRGSITLPNLTLNSVPQVPNLTCNLVSIRKLTRDFNRVIMVYLYLEFQDLHSGRTIGKLR